MHGRDEKFIQNLDRKTEGKKPFERSRYRKEDFYKIDLREVGCEMWTGFNWNRIRSSGRLLRTW
jgi:hypothetical protein